MDRHLLCQKRNFGGRCVMEYRGVHGLGGSLFGSRQLEPKFRKHLMDRHLVCQKRNFDGRCVMEYRGVHGLGGIFCGSRQLEPKFRKHLIDRHLLYQKRNFGGRCVMEYRGVHGPCGSLYDNLAGPRYPGPVLVTKEPRESETFFWNP